MHPRRSPACPAACGPVLSDAVTASDLHRPCPCSAFNDYRALASGGRQQRRTAQHAARGSGSGPEGTVISRLGAWPAEGRLAFGTLFSSHSDTHLELASFVSLTLTWKRRVEGASGERKALFALGSTRANKRLGLSSANRLAAERS